MKCTKIPGLVFIIVLTLFAGIPRAGAQGTAFTYQGRLDDSGLCANGHYDLKLQLFSAASGGTALYTSTTSTSDVLVSNGLFTVAIDFGAGVFNGPTYYLQTGVRTNGSSSAYANLAPRTQIMPTPYAIYAENSTSTSLLTDPGTENFYAGPSAGTSSASASENTAVGAFAFNSVTTGYENTAVGQSALESDTTGAYNSAFGADALTFNTAGTFNTAVGFASLNDTSGSFNTGVGIDTLETSAGGSNSVVGALAMRFNGSGLDNEAFGYQALLGNTTGSENIAVGVNALSANSIGIWNVGIGSGALGGSSDTNGWGNTAVGYETLSSLGPNAIGNIALGVNAGSTLTSGSGNIYIGNSGSASESDTIRIGADQSTTYLAGNVGLGGAVPQQTLSMDGGMNIDQASANTGSTANAFTFGSASGEGMGSQRTGGSTASGQFGLEFYTDFHNRMTILQGGNIGIGTTSPTSLLQVAGQISCQSITITSDRNAKEDFTSVDPRSVLEKVSSLPLTEWKYKQDAAGLKHIGPMAQDFQAAFGLNGADDSHISVVDEGGVALAAIQGLNAEMKDKDARIQELSQTVNELRKMVEQLEQKVASPKAQ